MGMRLSGGEYTMLDLVPRLVGKWVWGGWLNGGWQLNVLSLWQLGSCHSGRCLEREERTDALMRLFGKERYPLVLSVSRA